MSSRLQIEQVLPRKESIHQEVHLLRCVGRLTGRSVEGRRNGPGDRAPKLPSRQEPSLSTTTKATAPLRRMDVEGVLLPGSKSSARSESHSSGSWEISKVPRRPQEGRQPWERDEAVRHGGSLREVGRGHSTEEVGEDAGNARRVDGGKGRGHGETRHRKRALDAVRGNARPRTMASRSSFGAGRGSIVAPRWEPGAGNPLAGFCPGGRPKGRSLPERAPAKAGE